MKTKFEKKKSSKMLLGWIIAISIILVISLVTIFIKANYSNTWEWHGNWDLGPAFIYLIQKVYLDNFLKEAPIIISFLTFIGYIILGRGFREAIIGAIKTAIGILLLQIGSSILVGMARPVFESLGNLGSGTNIVPLDPYFGLTSSNDYLKEISESFVSFVSYVFVIGFSVNIILVLFKKWTNVHSLMITGHIMIQQSAIITALVYFLLFRGSTEASAQFGTVFISGILAGTYWGVASTSTIKPTNVLTNNAGFSIGHQQMFAIAASYKLGKYFGSKEESAENRILPKYLKIFEDNIFTQTIIITVLFLILFLVILLGTKLPIYNWNELQFSGKVPTLLGRGGFSSFAAWNVLGKANIVFQILFGSLKIVAALIAIMTGVRMFVTELQQSFQGISEKILKDSVPAVDVAATYGWGINSVTYGFLSGTIAQFAAVGVVIGLSAIPGAPIAIAIPLFITLFFNSGSLGVYANASGGYKAAIIVPAIIGFAEIILISFASGVVIAVAGSGAAHPFKTGFNGMADINLLFGSIALIGSTNIVTAIIVLSITFAGLILASQLIDSGMQTKATFLQRTFKFKPELIVHSTE